MITLSLETRLDVLAQLYREGMLDEAQVKEWLARDSLADWVDILALVK